MGRKTGSLEGRVAVVAGATRGAGRGIARALGEAGATVYCTGRSVRGKRIAKRRTKANAFDPDARPETIEETAEMVSAHGGVGVHARVDHTDEREVRALFRRVEREQGRLDVLVNDVWGGDHLTEWGKPFWECSLEKGLKMIERAVLSHVITSRHGVPLMVGQKRGLVVEITDGDGLYYRGQFFYDFVKAAVIRLAFAFAEELRRHRVAAVAVSPGFLRSEAMLEHLGVTEENWRDGAKKHPSFIESETPLLVGRGVAALAADPKVLKKSGKVFGSWTLAREYGLTDADGRQPRIAEWTATNMPGFLKQVRASEERFRRVGSIFADREK
ncbi:MAG TPA: SDR family oxidoreductase [Pyrinomonadaceae bacterium]|jgi:NAD(P)-dependent dehydrogenase (short-subunit alcohol dehydrogenase family)|nr:SDR family oxidoreductase [Pyrinomonadaceae bacterium]